MPKKAKTQAQKIADGRKAAELPEIMNEAMIAIDEDLTSRWRSSGESDGPEREAIWAKLKALEMIRDELTRCINDGFVAQKQKERGVIQ
jgi:hypothetical protein